jgi:RNA polymerase sigma-70 factor, ECF subfamily
MLRVANLASVRMSAAPQNNEVNVLVSLAAAGDPSAQRSLVERVRRRVHAIALSIMGNALDAEDTTQAILVEILRSAATFRGESLIGWADKIAARTAIRHARQRRMRAMQCEARDDLEELAEAAETEPCDLQLPRRMVEYLGFLPETRRVAIVLRHVMDYSVEEIAEMTEVSPNTVKDRLLHARAQLRRLIRRDLSLTPTGRQP